MTTPPTPDAAAVWRQLTTHQPALAAALAIHCRALPDDWPAREFSVARPDAAVLLPPLVEPEDTAYPIEAAPVGEDGPVSSCPACAAVDQPLGCRWHTGYTAGIHALAGPLHDAVKTDPELARRIGGWLDHVTWAVTVGDPMPNASPDEFAPAPEPVPQPAARPGTVDLLVEALAQYARETGNTGLRHAQIRSHLAETLAAVLPPAADACPYPESHRAGCGCPADIADLRTRTAALEGRLLEVLAVCDRAERDSLRWEQPLPVPEWVPLVRAAAGVAAPDAPGVVLPPAADQAAADLDETERAVLKFALDEAHDLMCSRDGFEDEDFAALESLRRLAAEPPTPDNEPQLLALCGRTRGEDGTDYPPCTRPAGHREAYCHSGGSAYFIAATTTEGTQP